MLVAGECCGKTNLYESDTRIVKQTNFKLSLMSWSDNGNVQPISTWRIRLFLTDI
jgi:hypothetical protein